MPSPNAPKSLHLHILDMRREALDERDKGDRFEALVKAFLQQAEQFKDRFSDVWLWKEWPGRGNMPDTGVDIVAQITGSDDVAFIQCKFYAEGSTVQKGDIDSFLALLGKKGVVEGYVFDTADRWSKNAVEALKDRAQHVQRIDLETMENAGIDWESFRWENPSDLRPAVKHKLRPHQKRAVDAVNQSFEISDRGKLIMACGTGKTFTSLKLAEAVGRGGRVLFLAPSIQLVSQTLTEWVAQTETPIAPFAVCSDVRVGRRSVRNEDDPEISTVDLPLPPTTNAELLAERASDKDSDHLTVVFSTYQSIKVIHEAQGRGMPEFDLVICDEAHRTTGATLAGQDESHFVKVHDGDYIKAAKRLYMTATPRVYGEDAKAKSEERGEYTLASMDDEDLFGPEFHRLGFSDAVEQDLLSDYKVLVLAVNEQHISRSFQSAMAIYSEIKLNEAARLVGCWNGLAKHILRDPDGPDQAPGPPMKTAVAFAESIKKSQQAAEAFPQMAAEAQIQSDNAPEDERRHNLKVEAEHVDGTMGIQERNAKLAWLKSSTTDGICRVLTNARCLSEGIDVPALDAVMFLSPRASQVDVVQSVGRVMRKAPGKDYGYVILPVVVPEGSTPEETMADNKRFKVVWQVLQALRSHDDRFNAVINRIEMNKGATSGPGPEVIIDEVGFTETGTETLDPADDNTQLVLSFPEEFRSGLYAKIVQKVGSRRYWEDWASDVAEIAESHIARINGLLADEDSPASKQFARFLDGLRGNLNESVTQDEAVEMLAQHLITRPIFDALFEGYNFTEHNPVAQAMERMLAVLDEYSLEAESDTLEGFYRQVQRRIEGVDNAEGRQKILLELYNNFFAKAFKRTVDKLGIVYTPVEIVDFILKSADDVCQKHFGFGLTDENVHILDGFTGTGTFIVRALQGGLIKPHDLARKYASELHANEILLLAYYIAAVNIETTYMDLTGEAMSFEGLVLTDTFQSYEADDRPDLEVIQKNNERIERQNNQKVTVIVGNPPYSAGQGSANDNNANEEYPDLDSKIRNTYAARSDGTLKAALYDSYIRAIKWATLRVGDDDGRGVIAFVTNGGWLDSNSADGMRKTLVDEFAEINVFNLRGNARTSGEQRRKEGGNVFDAGSRATAAIVVLVAKPDHTGPAMIHYSDVGDYLTREEKLAKTAEFMSVAGVPSAEIVPNEHGDWLNQRSEDFSTFLATNASGAGSGIFLNDAPGVQTNRDAWVYGFGSHAVTETVSRLIGTYESERLGGKSSGDATRDSRLVKWSGSLETRLDRGDKLLFDAKLLRKAMYRPFTREILYYSRELVHRPRNFHSIYPSDSVGNWSICVTGIGTTMPFCTLAVDCIPDLELIGHAQHLSRFSFEVADPNVFGQLDLGDQLGEIEDGFRRIDNITDFALNHFQTSLPDETITKDDIFNYVYGILHSPEYRETYAADLKKTLPRIPVSKNFRAFADAGEKLMKIHLEYESATPHPLDGLDAEPSGKDPYDFYAVKKMRFGKPTPDQKEAGERHDRSTIIYNDQITLTGIPEEAYRYVLGTRSAIDWIIDRYQVKTDKASGIVSDPNEWSREVEDPRYILDLVARIITVSLQTVEVVESLPALDVLDGATGRQ